MKKLLLIASSLFIGTSIANAQSSLQVTNASNGNSVITNGMTLYRSVNALGMDVLDINIKNTSSSTKTYKMRMFYDVRNVVAAGDSANPYFCFGGQCYTPNVFTSPKTETLTPNGDATTNGHPISIHYDEASVAGVSSIRYRIFETTNASVDMMEFTIKYNDPAASVKTYSSLLSSVSDVYPNPSNTKAFISVNSIIDDNTSSVTITNALGSIVSSKNVDLSIGKNTIPLEIETLSSGIYFATIISGNYKTVKKFTINK
ncbi:MAG: T9SS type A sorting domain-containing protein [Bacteroidia bacterium]|nr:T9SS type A sorting domain-containing protein [Bacteroidia bacterium]